MNNSGQMTEYPLCTRPFTWFEVHPDGSVFLCCPAWRKTPAGNLLHQSVKEIWNGQIARSARGSVFKGSFQGCHRRRCPHLANSTPPVLSRSALPHDPVGKAMRQGEVALSYGPRILNLCFDISCNIACASCRGEILVSRGDARRQAETIAQKIVDEAGGDAERLILSGFGDPFGSPVYRQMFAHFRSESFPRLSRIDLHTNGLLWNETSWQELSAIHPYVRSAEISIDAATSGTYALNRGGADFQRLQRNLAFLQRLGLQVKISFVVQANNFREIPAFAALGERYGFSVYFSQLVNWGTFCREEYHRRAIHLPEHPEHAALLERLKSIVHAPHVDLGNLAPLLRL